MGKAGGSSRGREGRKEVRTAGAGPGAACSRPAGARRASSRQAGTPALRLQKPQRGSDSVLWPTGATADFQMGEWHKLVPSTDDDAAGVVATGGCLEGAEVTDGLQQSLLWAHPRGEHPKATHCPRPAGKLVHGELCPGCAPSAWGRLSQPCAATRGPAFSSFAGVRSPGRPERPVSSRPLPRMPHRQCRPRPPTGVPSDPSGSGVRAA